MMNSTEIQFNGIRNAMIKKQVEPRELARRLQVHRNTVQAWLAAPGTTNHRQIKFVDVIRVLQALGYTNKQIARMKLSDIATI